VGSAGIPAGVVIAVGRHQLLDIQVVLNRAVVYVLLTGLLVLAYFAAVLGVGTTAGQRVGIIAVAVLALLLAFGSNRLQTLVDRLLYGQRRDPYASSSASVSASTRLRARSRHSPA
jgi:two-component system NarL family sensor kinase